MSFLLPIASAGSWPKLLTNEEKYFKMLRFGYLAWSVVTHSGRIAGDKKTIPFILSGKEFTVTNDTQLPY